MRSYDVIVVGKGSSRYVIAKAAHKYNDVAVIDDPPIGGTCMNFGCLPTKSLIYPADRIRDIYQSQKLNIDAEVLATNFSDHLAKVRKDREKKRQQQKSFLTRNSNIYYFPGKGHFIDKETLKVNGKKLKGEKIFLANGTRPLIPPIKGLENIDYLTNRSILELKQKPESMIIIGGGYIALEYAHLLSAYGIDITIIEMMNQLLPSMEPEISKKIEEEVQNFADLHLGTTASEVIQNGDIEVKIENNIQQRSIQAESLFIATGRKSNADTLNLEKTDIETDADGFIKVNKYLETNQENVWAWGDVIGKEMFKHTANQEARIAWYNATNLEKKEMQYHASPKVVFTHPEIGSVGLTEAEAQQNHSILIGKAKFEGVEKGSIMKDYSGVVKAVVNKSDRRLLGFHVIGPHASILLQEAAVVIANRETVDFIINSTHTFPSLSEIVLKPLLHLKEPK